MKVKVSKKDAGIFLGLHGRIGGAPTGPRGALDRIAEVFYKGGAKKQRFGKFPHYSDEYFYVPDTYEVTKTA